MQYSTHFNIIKIKHYLKYESFDNYTPTDMFMRMLEQ